jgi:nitrogenase subunit NifH
MHARAFISDLITMGIPKQDIQVIINIRIRTEIQMNLHQVGELLGQTPMIMITPAPELLHMANRMKTTAVSAQPESMTGQQFAQLANAITDLMTEPQ